MLFIFAVMFGVFDYSTVPITASLVASHIGLRVMGLSMGILMAGHSLGAAVAAFLGGYLFDLFASYDWVWILAIVTAVSAAFICLTIPERRGPVAREAAVFT
jgi:MFS family permease